jgi:hypothetical protein
MSIHVNVPEKAKVEAAAPKEEETEEASPIHTVRVHSSSIENGPSESSPSIDTRNPQEN